MDNEIIKRNEEAIPQLKELRTVVNDKTKPMKERCQSAFCYVAIALALDKKK